MAESPVNVLFLCTHNSSRSIMAEALLNHLGRGQFRGFSAGSMPSGRVHPLALAKAQLLDHAGNPWRSKSWDEFGGPAAPRMDLIITVCDNAAGEACPFWPGHPATAHWGFPDPSAVSGSEGERQHAFDEVFDAIRRHLEALVKLPVHRLSAAQLAAELAAIHRLHGLHRP